MFQASGPNDVAAAFAAAAEAQPAWAAMPAPRRGEYLFKAADCLESQLSSAATEMTREEGKTLPEATGEVKRAINILRYFAARDSGRSATDSVRTLTRLCFTCASRSGWSLDHTVELPIAIRHEASPAW